jgi:hypothetical protein
MCLSDKVPAVVRSVFYGASLCALCALMKKEGRLRPTAVGSTLHRLVAKTAVEQDSMVVKPGFDVKLGVEAVALAARCVTTNIDKGEALLTIYFTNVFNTLSCNVMLTVICEELPEFFSFIDNCHSGHSFVRFRPVHTALVGRTTVEQSAWSAAVLHCCYASRELHQVTIPFMIH